jgi:hypothetical protein
VYRQRFRLQRATPLSAWQRGAVLGAVRGALETTGAELLQQHAEGEGDAAQLVLLMQFSGTDVPAETAAALADIKAALASAAEAAVASIDELAEVAPATLAACEASDDADAPCGGDCAGCSAGAACAADQDCIDGNCGSGVCVAPANTAGSASLGMLVAVFCVLASLLAVVTKQQELQH